MWALFDLVVLFLEAIWLLPPRKPGSTADVNERMSRGLEPFRWVIYGVILFGVAMLLCAGVVLLFAP